MVGASMQSGPVRHLGCRIVRLCTHGLVGPPPVALRASALRRKPAMRRLPPPTTTPLPSTLCPFPNPTTCTPVQPHPPCPSPAQCIPFPTPHLAPPPPARRPTHHSPLQHVRVREEHPHHAVLVPRQGRGLVTGDGVQREDADHNVLWGYQSSVGIRVVRRSSLVRLSAG